MELRDVDLFGVFEDAASSTDAGDSADDAVDVPVTYDHYRALVCMMAERLGVPLDKALHLFNVEPATVPATRSQDASAAPRGGHTNPFLCAHLSREGVQQYHRHEVSLPTIVCRPVDASSSTVSTADCVQHVRQETRVTATTTVSPSNGLVDPACTEGPPHVHCCYCVRQAVDRSPLVRPGVPPPAVDELTRCDAVTGVPLWCAHAAEHDRRMRKFWAMLDEEAIAYLGESGDEFDLDTEEGKVACEEAAEEESRHGCFMVSAGTAACPLVLFYCAHCEQFAPLLHVEPTDSVESGWVLNLEDAEEPWPVILSKLFIGFHFWSQAPHAQPIDSERAGIANSAAPDACEATPYVFLYKPELLDTDDATEAFEEGVEATYGAAILPGAHVMVRAGDDVKKACLVLLPSCDNVSLGPPYTFDVAVEGFLMAWPSAAEAQAKCAMVCASDDSYRVTQRLVYVAELGDWVCAHVLYHSTLPNEASEAAAWMTYNGSEDDYGAIRCLTNVVVPTALPHARSPTAPDDSTNDQPVTGEEADEVELMAAPYSMEARTMNFFGRMTLLAKAMAEASRCARYMPSRDEDKTE